MRRDRFFKHQRLPFVELRYSTGSTASFKPHIHRNLSIGAVDQGEVHYIVNGQQSVLRPGSLALVNPETLHACNPATAAGRSFSMLFLDVDWCVRVQQAMWHIDRFVAMEFAMLEDHVLYDQYCRTVEWVMDPGLHLQGKEQQLVDLVTDVFDASCRPQAEIRELEGDTGVLRDILSSNLEEDLTLDSLAERLGTNPYTLIRRFKAQTGITPHAYRMNCRIDKAKGLLREGRDIGETALECGFFDQSHFHRHFKAMTTVTPQQYRVNFVQ